MKALQFHGHDDIRLDDVPEPEVRPGWSVIEVGWASICRSDIKEWHGPLYIKPDRPNPLTGVSVPVILGHEFAGRVVATDGSDPRIRVGDRVAVDGCIKCGECWYCTHGNYVLCDKLAILGFDAHGGLAQKVSAPNYSIHRLPDSVSDEAAALLEPLSVSVHGVRRSGLRVGDIAVVTGGGMIGLGCMAVAKASGASAVYLVEPMPARRARAAESGATAVIDPTAGDPVEQLRELTGGHMADVVFECAGNERSMRTSIALCRKGGRIAVIATFPVEPTLPLIDVVLTEKEIVGVLAYVDDFPRAISLVADGRVKTDHLITGRIALRDVIDQGFHRLADEPDQHLRIIIDAQAV